MLVFLVFSDCILLNFTFQVICSLCDTEQDVSVCNIKLDDVQVKGFLKIKIEVCEFLIFLCCI